MRTLCQNAKLGVTTLVPEISCVVDHAKLPNLVIIAVVGFIYFWRKNESLLTTGSKEDAVMKFNLNGSIKWH